MNDMLKGISSEGAEQAAVVEWCELMGVPVIHIPNEGKRSEAAGANLKRLGLSPGFPDLFIFRVRGRYHGFAIEMKYGKGKLSGDQKAWLRRLKSEGYATAVCYSAEEAIRLIEKYEKLK